MKIFFTILASIGALVVIAITAVLFMTAGMSDTADSFFTAIKTNNYDKAYSLLSENFKSNTSKNQLKTYLIKNALNKFKEASWESRSVNGGRGKLSGSITKSYSGIQEENDTTQMPTEKEQIKLVSESMHIFAVSVGEKSISKMFSHISNLWKKQFSEKKFNEIFKPFYTLEYALMVLDKHTPKFTEKPSITDDGVLIIKGFYPTKPDKVTFKHQYIYEGIGWKLVGFKINID